jgi:hypothetical protein
MNIKPFVWKKFPICYSQFNIALLDNPEIKLINYIKKIFPDKASIIDYSKISLNPSTIVSTFHINLSNVFKNKNELATKSLSCFYPQITNKSQKFQIFIGNVPNNVLSFCDIIIGDNEMFKNYLKNVLNYSLQNLDPNVYFVLDKRSIHNYEFYFIEKKELDRF